MEPGLEKSAHAAVVAHEDHDGVFADPRLVDDLQPPGDVLVDIRDHPVDSRFAQRQALGQVLLDVWIGHKVRRVRRVLGQV